MMFFPGDKVKLPSGRTGVIEMISVAVALIHFGDDIREWQPMRILENATH